MCYTEAALPPQTSLFDIFKEEATSSGDTGL